MIDRVAARRFGNDQGLPCAEGGPGRGSLPVRGQAFRPYPDLVGPVMLRAMPYFLEYVTDAGAGLFTVEGVTPSHILETAKEALRGIQCTRAALLYSPGPVAVFGQGAVRATYTPAAGWMEFEEEDRFPNFPDPSLRSRE